MFLLLICLSGIFFLSTCILAYLLWKKSKIPPAVPTKDATELLSDLMRGGAVIVTSVVNPAEVFMWSPKDIEK